MIDMKRTRTNSNQRRAYCTKCHFTLYAYEGVVTDNGVVHSNCEQQLSDLSIKRTLNPRIQNMIGNASRTKVVELLQGRKSF